MTGENNFIDMAINGVAALLNAYSTTFNLKSFKDSVTGTKGSPRQGYDSMQMEAIKSRIPEVQDFKNHYLHLIITPSLDACSEASFEQLIEM